MDALKAIQTDSQNDLNTVSACVPAYVNAIAEREIAFEPLGKLITRVMNALRASGTNPAIKAKAAALVRKLQGYRLSSRSSKENNGMNSKEVNKISSSQLGFNNRVSNLDKLINLLRTIPEYNPNEPELKVDSLAALMEDLRAKNNAVIEATTPLSNARIARNNILYNNGSGLVERAFNVKAYVKSIYGATSPQYHQVSGLEFRRARM
ncbi:MAG: hypothetical protein JW894_06260 [Bacteroidales bacterium]|nr:hypothetical protein [Bacteroidales bacterium]